MFHEHSIASLWAARLRLYERRMPKTLYNLRLLADRKLRQSRFDLFLDSYGASLDAYPVCYSPAKKRGVEALWQDFVQISQDTNKAFEKNSGQVASKDE